LPLRRGDAHAGGAASAAALPAGGPGAGGGGARRFAAAAARLPGGRAAGRAGAAGTGGVSARPGDLNSREQSPVVVELVLPVAVDRGQPARRAAAADVEPADVFAALVERHADGDLELLTATRAGAFLQLRIFQELAAVPDRVLG